MPDVIIDHRSLLAMASEAPSLPVGFESLLKWISLGASFSSAGSSSGEGGVVPMCYASLRLELLLVRYSRWPSQATNLAMVVLFITKIYTYISFFPSSC